MALDEQDVGVVIDAMGEKKVAPGEVIINQGDMGDVLYLVEEGNLECFKKFETEEKLLRTYVPGDAFGELALLYNARRQATIKAKTQSHLWVLDRGTFNHIVKDAAQKKREKYEDFLKSVTLFQSMDHYERSKLANVIKDKVFQSGETILKQGEEGDTFYILIDGQARATKKLKEGG